MSHNTCAWDTNYPVGSPGTGPGSCRYGSSCPHRWQAAPGPSFPDDGTFDGWKKCKIMWHRKDRVSCVGCGLVLCFVQLGKEP